MKIIISPAKTVSKKIEGLNNKENFSKKTYEILERVPQVRLSSELFKAFYMYDGLCFKNMNREDLDSKDLDYIDKHLFILSALYGAVRPFDLISPYRLDFLMKTEMGNLYKFWQDEIAKKVLEDEDLIVNLASDEFSKTIKKYIKDEKILNIEFFENVDGNLKKHSTISKKARGKMLYFMTKNKIEDIEDIKKFNLDGYSFSEEKSTKDRYVFIASR